MDMVVETDKGDGRWCRGLLLVAVGAVVDGGGRYGHWLLVET